MCEDSDGAYHQVGNKGESMFYVTKENDEMFP